MSRIRVSPRPTAPSPCHGTRSFTSSLITRYDGERAAGTDNHTLNARLRLSF